jgi:subtilase family serine protease
LTILITEGAFVNRLLKLAALSIAALAVAACSAGGISNLSERTGVPSARVPSAADLGKLWGPNVKQVCATVRGGPQCLALLRTGLAPNNEVLGMSPKQFKGAYGLPSSKKSSGQIVAIVDAYDNPNVASDLAHYRSWFRLPAAKFTKYNEYGQTSNYPPPNAGWGLEIDLDVEMVSASCPNCTIYLIENSGNTSDFEAAEAEAATLGAHIISNSWICYGDVDCGDPTFSSYFDAPGVLYLAASGDYGYGYVGAPMAFASVVSVGGTRLTSVGNKRGWTEVTWYGTGSGCATGITKPSWQHDTGCPYRTDNDIAADADPNTGAAVYDTYDYSGWTVVGGTSLASPLLAGVYGLAGNASRQNAAEKFYKLKEPYQKKELYDITSGSNNGSCDPSYLCVAGKGYDGPTGWGTPRGSSAF